ncbi:hypothetical protein VOLCADRAFT_97779 [Volvox carteri f. nagariensis]|uniref:Uncharacterized protein n=1 Tax=Volvox carteri f. nagariensis TaxID=3068 RepID=D8UDL9_VOLCA|nr:uncharacterized protein VOLCADRAFT_97779 [Volvox carteri f. nagariensis]EFJ42216.1 hypothetical protein VOLCADRAFT_97779 [Volvox carteri f. nagariensis]|eukprot:XP_002956759.1 hypothetical protein VOLCADRAFT_97779 [Volvox carteri f. nagariensis]
MTIKTPPAGVVPQPVPYDVLSINIGIAPGRAAVPGVDEHATPVKPIDGFVRQYEQLLERYSLLCRGGLLPGHPPHVRRLARQLLTQRGVEINTHTDTHRRMSD